MSSAEYTRGKAYLTELAAATGGKVFRPESTPGGLTAAFEGIAEELRRQYNIGYYPRIQVQPASANKSKCELIARIWLFERATVISSAVRKVHN